MSEDTTVVLVVGLAVLITVASLIVVIVVARRMTRRTNEAWAAAAGVLGGSFHPATTFGQPRLDAVIEGFEATAYGFTRSSGSSSSNTHTAYRVSYPLLGLGLSIERQGMWQQLGAMFGGRDIEVGDPAFDELVVVKGDDPQRVAAFLDEARRLAVHRLVAEFGGVKITDDHIAWSSSGRERDPDRIVSVLRRFVSVARTLQGGVRRSMTEALRAQAEGDPGRAVAFLAADPWQPDALGERSGEAVPDPEERFITGVAAYSGGRYYEAAEAMRDVEAALPADEQAAKWRRRAEERAALPVGEERPDVETIDDPAGLADEVFAPGMMTFDGTAAFEDRFEGRRVRWKGTLVRSRPYRSDLDFGRGPGTKAVFRVYRLGFDLYGGRDVDAVVRLGEEAHEVLRDRREEEFTFEGTLLRVDSLMRNVYVEDGSLVAGSGE